MKRAVLLLTVILLTVACIIPISALTLPVLGGNAGQIIVISGDMADIDKKIIVLEESEELTTAHFPMGNIYGYLDENGRGQLLEVEWDISDETLAESGLHEVTGTPILAENTVLADGYDGIVTWPVFRIGEGVSLEAESVRFPILYEPLISQNGDCESELELKVNVTNLTVSETWKLDVNSDPAFCWEWDLSAVDTENLGRYPISAELCCPDWLTLPEEYLRYETTAYVLPTDRVEIYAAVRSYSEDEMSIRWLYDCENVTEAVLEQKISDGVWEVCDESWYTFHPWNKNRNAFLSLHPNNIPSETTLTLRLRYLEATDAETTERVTESILLTIPENLSELTEGFDRSSIITRLEGDRDGGDIGGAVLPDIDQPAPDIGFAADQQIYQKLLRETVTDTSTSVTGLRVNMQAERENTVLFEKHGVSAEIPSDILKKLNMYMTDTLTVTIIRPETDTVQFSVTVNDIYAEDLDGTVIRMPWNGDITCDLACYDINDIIVSDAVYEESSGTVMFTVCTSGLYRIAEAVKETEQSTTEEAESDSAEEALPETAPESETTPLRQMAMETKIAAESETETESEAEAVTETVREYDITPVSEESAEPTPETTVSAETAETIAVSATETAAVSTAETSESVTETTADEETDIPDTETQIESSADVPQNNEILTETQYPEAAPERTPNTAVTASIVIASAAVLGACIIIARGKRHG